MNLDEMQKTEDKLGEIRAILNPVDAPYICDVIINNISDEMLNDLIMDMMVKMGYNKKKILKIAQIINQIQS